jgi:putative chitinase
MLLSRPVPPDVALDAPLAAVAPHLTPAERSDWVKALSAPLRRAAVTTPRRVAAFLGQCAVESGGFRTLEEDLAYSAPRLCQVWPNHFPDQAAARACAFQPEALADVVYANRLGDGPPGSGDGWRFRGRGLIQITGRSAYERFAKSMGMTLDQAVEHAATHGGAADSAAWFWGANDLNKLADAWTLEKLTRAVNGGLLGATERSRLCAAALQAIGV